MNKKHFFMICVLLFACFWCLAQDTTEKSLEEEYKAHIETRNKVASTTDLSDSVSNEINLGYKKLEQKQLEYKNAEYNYEIDNLKFRQSVFKFQAFSSKIIFAFVLLVVFCGLAFAAIQFYKSIKVLNKANATNVEISLSGVKVSSSILGVIVLVISLVFFYLYLIYVYPIKEINFDSKEKTEKAKEEKAKDKQ